MVAEAEAVDLASAAAPDAAARGGSAAVQLVQVVTMATVGADLENLQIFGAVVAVRAIVLLAMRNAERQPWRIHPPMVNRASTQRTG